MSHGAEDAVSLTTEPRTPEPTGNQLPQDFKPKTSSSTPVDASAGAHSGKGVRDRRSGSGHDRDPNLSLSLSSPPGHLAGGSSASPTSGPGGSPNILILDSDAGVHPPAGHDGGGWGHRDGVVRGRIVHDHAHGHGRGPWNGTVMDRYSARYMFVRDPQKLSAYDLLRSTLDRFVPLSLAADPPLLIPPLYNGDTRRVRARELLILMELLVDDDSDPEKSMLDVVAARFFTSPVQSKEEEARVAVYGRMFLEHIKRAPPTDIAQIVYRDVFGGGAAGEKVFRALFFLDLDLDLSGNVDHQPKPTVALAEPEVELTSK